MRKQITPPGPVKPRTVCVAQSTTKPLSLLSQSTRPLQSDRSTTTRLLLIGKLARSRTVTQNSPRGSITPPLLPTSAKHVGQVELAGLGTLAIAALAANRPQTANRVALRTKPVIVAPP